MAAGRTCVLSDSASPIGRRPCSECRGPRSSGSLTCYLLNLADDLQRLLVHGSIDPEVLPQVRDELRAIAKALDTGAPLSPIPAIPSRSPGRTRRQSSRPGDRERAFDDDEIPF